MMNDRAASYDLLEHRKRFSAWCGSTAAMSSTKCRFTVEQGFRLIKHAKLDSLAAGWDVLPVAGHFDTEHRKWREVLVEAAPHFVGTGPLRNFTHGVAAKLINCYLKPIYLCGISDSLSEIDKAKRDAIHPPIDRVLLMPLKDKNVGGIGRRWGSYATAAWSTFSSEQYEEVINDVRSITGGRLWTVESYWQGHQ